MKIVFACDLRFKKETGVLSIPKGRLRRTSDWLKGVWVEGKRRKGLMVRHGDKRTSEIVRGTKIKGAVLISRKIAERRGEGPWEEEGVLVYLTKLNQARNSVAKRLLRVRAGGND